MFFFLLAFGAGLFIFLGWGKEVVETVPVEQVVVETPIYKVIGKSVEDRDIESYTYGNGDTHLLFVGGIHGGYEWNNVLLAYEFMDYLKENPNVIPANLKVSVIPSANPDGVFKIVGKEGRFALSEVPVNVDSAPGRFNANDVDLNRNFDCKWKPESTWRSQKVSAGSKVFSEPESQAIRDFVLENQPAAAIFWHSQANSVYASECKNGVLPETIEIMNAYAKASGYTPVKTFDSYEVTGDAEGWLASMGIPAITVELKTHETIEWQQNLRGVQALFDHYKKQVSL